MQHPGRLESAVQACSILQRPFVDKDGMIRKLPYPAGDITSAVSLPSIAANRLRKRMKNFSSPAKGKGPVIALYAGCVTAYAYPELGENVMKVLGESGTAPYYPEKQACCGAPAYFSGDPGSALSLARHNIEALSEADADYVVTVCPGCAAMLKNEYPKLTAGDPELHEKALKLAPKVREFSQLMIELGDTHEKKAPTGKKVTYHDPCHLKRGLGISEEPRQLIRDAGYELVEMNDADACCGFGGDALMTHPELCGSILKRKLANIEATGVDTVVTACTACVLQLRGGLDKKRSPSK